MEKRCFILFRNKGYAESVKEMLSNGIIRNSESEIIGITPRKHDVFYIDAHFGECMSTLKGLDIVNYLNERACFVNVFSWFTEQYIIENYPDKTNLFSNPNIKYIRFPIIHFKKNYYDQDKH